MGMSKGEKIDATIAMGFVLAIFAPIVHWFAYDVRWADYAVAAVVLFWAVIAFRHWRRG